MSEKSLRAPMFDVLPTVVLDYAGDNRITIKNNLFPNQTKDLLSRADYEVWKDDDSVTQNKTVFRELLSLARVMALSELRFNESGEKVNLFRANVIVPANFWEESMLRYMFNFVGHRNSNHTDTWMHLKGMSEHLPPGYGAKVLIYITPRDDVETVSLEDTPVDKKAAFLEKLAQYIGDQDIDHVLITTKAGAKIRVDP